MTIAENHQYAVQSDIDALKSLIVTEQPILARFSFQRVMDQLVAQSGVPGLTSLALFHQWFDTQNPAAIGVGPGVHCDSQTDFLGGPGINSYPYLCRPAPLQEGAEASSDPFSNPDTSPSAYLPIALTNRFDLAPASGANCGEHRIVYARRSGIADARNRNLIIFEATMPNPHLGQGLKGCDKIVKFWANLSKSNNLNSRASDLENFYFNGVANLPPVVEISHYGDNATGVGQIRTNQFMQPLPVTPLVWNLREFKLLRTCSGGACSAMKVVPVTDKTNPFGPLFAPAGTHPQKPAFDAFFSSQVQALAAPTLAGIDMKIPDVYNTAQSLASGSTENDYVDQFTGVSTLRSNIQSALNAIPSPLTPDDIVARARALSCAGCHRFSGNANAQGNNFNLGGSLVWPASLGFTHTSEQAPITGADGVTRFQISPALTSSFLPVRKQVLQDFLDDKPPNTHSPDDPIGGRRVH